MAVGSVFSIDVLSLPFYPTEHDIFGSHPTNSSDFENSGKSILQPKSGNNDSSCACVCFDVTVQLRQIANEILNFTMSYININPVDDKVPGRWPWHTQSFDPQKSNT